MKVIELNACKDCPYITPNKRCRIVFDSDAGDLRKIPDMQEIPEWCPLEDAKVQP